MSPAKANLCGFAAIICWSFTALIISFSRDIPPLYLAGASLLVGFLGFLAVWKSRHVSVRAVFRLPASLYALGLCGIAGYYGFYITGLKTAPIAEANLINYLWPILLVLFSAGLPGLHLRWFSVAGAMLGLAGVYVVVSSHEQASLFHTLKSGHLLALAGAVIWATYSTVLKLYRSVSSDAVGVFLFLSGCALLVLHGLCETAFRPDMYDCLVIILCGIVSPLGYYLWDIGMKKGDVSFIAVLSFLTPLFSTTWLVLFSRADLHAGLAWGGLIIFAGTLLAGLEKLQAFKTRLFPHPNSATE